jgi:hypothetical protein
MALGTYSDLSTAIGTWEERTFTSGETDEFILLAEANANLRLASDYRRRGSATVNTDSSGVGTLPTSFIGMSALTRDVLGSLPLKQVSYGAFIERNPYEVSDDAQVYALLSATTLIVSPVTDDNFLAVYSTVVPALSGSNATNWLLTLAPHYYLFACQSAAAAKFKSYQEAAMLDGKANEILDQVISQGNVAEFGNAELTMAMCTP